jgi:nitroimidazol reductase NimA-like FMN-containing flavoprotein (pyridoxamine 5'-phosphate oxidase superfamily)
VIGSLTESEIDAVLRSQVLGRLGCNADGRPYVVPVAYAYDAGTRLTD